MKLTKILSLAALPVVALSLSSCGGNDDRTAAKNVEATAFAPQFNSILGASNNQDGIDSYEWNSHFKD